MRDWRDLMKVIETIINTANLDELKAALNNIGIEKIMVSHSRKQQSQKGARRTPLGCGLYVWPYDKN